MHPFDHVRARFLIPWLLLAGILSFVPVVAIWPEWLNDGELDTPLPGAVGVLAFAILISAIPALRARRAGLVIGALYRELPPYEQLPRLAALAFPMLGAAFVGIYVLYAPLSLVVPEEAQAWLFEDQLVLYSAGLPYPWFGNLLGLLSFAIAAPFAEEWFFRGLLLNRWSRKWGPVRAVVASSLVFALLHTDILGGFVFGVFMCALCARYQSLWAPTIVHGANNTLAWCLAAFDAHYPIPIELDTVAELRAAWWLPAVGLLLVLPWALRLRGQYGPMSSWSFVAPPKKTL